MIKIKMPDLTIRVPKEPDFWAGVALQARRRIRTRTARDKSDVKGRPFKAYSDAYKEFRKSKGRSIIPNLTFTGRMLGSIQAVGKRMKGQLLLSGEEGFKASANEDRGRKFFDLAPTDRDSIIKKVADWMTRKNRLRPGR